MSNRGTVPRAMPVPAALRRPGRREATSSWPLLVVLLGVALPGVGVASAAVEALQAQGGPEVKIVSPRRDGEMPDPVVVQVLVRPRPGTRVVRVEAWLDDSSLGELARPPYRWTAPRPAPGIPASLRVEAEDDLGGTGIARMTLSSPDTTTFRAEVPAVRFNLAVRDGVGRPVEDLRLEEVVVRDNGQPQEVLDLARIEAPLKVVLLVDRSASMADRMPRTRRAVAAFLGQLGEDDRVKLIGFNDRVTSFTPFTTEHEVVAAFASAMEAGGSTALHDALLYALRQLGAGDGAQAGEAERQRPVILVVTDGRDEQSRFALERVLEAVRRAGATVYALGQGEALEDDELRRILEEMTRATGGEARFEDDPDRLPAVLASVGRTMRSLYLVSYRPTGDTPGWHRIEVEIRRPGVEVRHRFGYRVERRPDAR